jgi:DMSO/TMAO reductase YedYZ heme-binding membrane subunit
MSDLWWFVSRATGIVATALAVAAVVFGFFFSSRNTGRRRRPAWWLDLHNWLGGAALAFTLVHVATIYLDDNSGIDLLAALVPGAADEQRWAIAWGVIAMYLFALTVFTSWPRKRLRPRAWRVVHLGSVVGAVLAGIHAFQVGSDATNVVFEAGLVVGAALLVYAAVVRVLGLVIRRTD